MSSSAFVPNFLPSMSGFHLPNNPPNFPIITIGLPGGQSIGFGGGLAARGLCGGFSFAVRDFYSGNVLMIPQFAPSTATGTPAGGSPLFEYFVRRQVDSFNINLGLAADGLKWLIWPLLPTHDTQTSWLTGVHGLSYLMVKDEVPKILADLNNGFPCILGLVEPSVGVGHQVVAWGFTLDDSSNLTLFVYDPNQPEVDDATIELNIGQSYHTIPITATSITNILGTTIIGIFHQSYFGPQSREYATDLALFGGPKSPSDLQPLAPGWRPWNRFGVPPGTNLQFPFLPVAPPALSPIGLTGATGPAACSWGPGRLDVFVQDNLTGIDHFWWANDSPNWESFSECSLTFPAAVSWGNNRIDLFAVDNGDDYSLIHYWYDGVWHPWESLSQPGRFWDGTPRLVNSDNWVPWGYPDPAPNDWILTPPTACSWGPNHLDVFVMSGSRISPPGWSGAPFAMPFSSNDWYLRQITFDTDGWSPWKGVPGIIRITPGGGFAATSWGPGRIDLFAIDTTGSLRHLWYANNQWNGPAGGPLAWENLGAPPAPANLVLGASPTASSWGPNRLDVFALGGTDSALWHIWYDGTWHPWESLGGFLAGPPGSASWGPNRLDVFASAQDFNLWHLWFDSQ